MPSLLARVSQALQERAPLSRKVQNEAGLAPLRELRTRLDNGRAGVLDWLEGADYPDQIEVGELAIDVLDKLVVEAQGLRADLQQVVVSAKTKLKARNKEDRAMGGE